MIQILIKFNTASVEVHSDCKI